ncbi:beta-ketoacyl-ACP synthase [Methylovulum psychrotolerans]|uniref:Beta-ketoacyl-[acyl-carrier-protein] synthase II n=1 Tax=Methylovulum psychrotolerans TaxID=1704499 RepID=A0A2S5CGW9_9GAMM|nr:beta-ketoacyl-ACP synthase [Methylovulum psychrotolerans]POZ50046.1 beta-ketoacyl-[acyl-carrier-protein] synthase II [Methylovulum psychrotolerans]
MKFYLNDLGIVSPLGDSKTENLKRVLAGDQTGFVLAERLFAKRPAYVGEVQANLPRVDTSAHVYYDCRNNRLLLAALDQIKGTVDGMIRRFGANRIGVVIGTSTSGLSNTESAWAGVAQNGHKPDAFHYKQQQLAGGADFLAAYLGLTGPAYAISTACSSSGRALVSARRLLALDICDAVIVGGADSLCRYTVHGFAALESVAAGLCKPFGLNRDGINIAEAAALFVMSKEAGPVQLSGIGASSDAYHFSAPAPDGKSVIKAMRMALQEAGKAAGTIDYLNLHGTATPLNDAMESRSVFDVFADGTAASSTKGMTGHALGAAAALELGFCWLLLTADDPSGELPPNINGDEFDPALAKLNFVKPGHYLGRKINACQSNSFAFGGNNLSIVVART